MSEATDSKLAPDIQGSLSYINAWQDESSGTQLHEFYSQLAVQRRGWDTRRSMRSAADKACDEVIRLAQASQGSGPTVYAFGMDGMQSEGNTKHAPTGMDTKFAKHLIQKIHEQNRDDVICRCNEYCTSKICPKCLQGGHG